MENRGRVGNSTATYLFYQTINTIVFSKPYGIVRFSEYGGWSQAGYGWDLIPEN